MSTAQRSKGEKKKKKINPKIELVGKNKQGLPAGRLQSRRCVLTGFSSVAACWIKHSEAPEPCSRPTAELWHLLVNSLFHKSLLN